MGNVALSKPFDPSPMSPVTSSVQERYGFHLRERAKYGPKNDPL